MIAVFFVWGKHTSWTYNWTTICLHRMYLHVGPNAKNNFSNVANNQTFLNQSLFNKIRSQILAKN